MIELINYSAPKKIDEVQPFDINSLSDKGKKRAKEMKRKKVKKKITTNRMSALLWPKNGKRIEVKKSDH